MQQLKPNIHALLRHAEATQTFLHWLRTEGDDLVAAAELLGGHRWSDRAKSVVNAVRAGHDVAAYRLVLGALHRLLHLDLVQDFQSEEARRFSAIHPDDPRADAARRCADALDRGLRAIEALRLAGQVSVREAA